MFEHYEVKVLLFWSDLLTRLIQEMNIDSPEQLADLSTRAIHSYTSSEKG